MATNTFVQKAKTLFGGEERGVSPVIGIILMVAITVILAAVIGVFVLGFSDDLDDSVAPQASLSFSEEPDDDDNISVTISHQGGDALSDDASLGGSVGFDNGDDSVVSGLSAGDVETVTITSGSGTLTVVDGDHTVGSYEVQGEDDDDDDDDDITE